MILKHENGQDVECRLMQRWYHVSTYCTKIFQVDNFSGSAFPSFMVTGSFMVAGLSVPAASVDASGSVVPVVAISFISSLILRVTASCTAPGGLTAISLTSLSVRTWLRREARDCRSSVAGPSKLRNSYVLSAYDGK